MAHSVQRLVVIGADAAGMSAASQALRVAAREGRELDVLAFERSHHTSYSACGIPYWVGGDVADPDALVARTPEQHRRNGIDLRLRHEVTAIDLDRGEVRVRELGDGDGGGGGGGKAGGDGDRRTATFGFDQLVIATGAVPVRPPVPGIDAEGVLGVQTLDDGAAVLDWLKRLHADRPRPWRAVVVGGGYIGVEMAEALLRHGCSVRMVTMDEEPMATLDPDMGKVVREALVRIGVEVHTRAEVTGFEVDGDGSVRAVVTKDGSYDADVVVLGTGVRPNTDLLTGTGIALGDFRGVRTDLRMAVPGHPGVWAAGDCVESFDRVSQSWVHVALGTHANKQGRVAGTNIGGGYATFPGIVRTAVSKVCDLEIARTGLREIDARRAGFRYVVGRAESTTRAGYFPKAAPMIVKALAEVGTGRLLGVQIVGWGPGAAKRIDAAALALWHRMTAAELALADLSYAPPFSPVWDPVQIAARRAADALAG